MRTLICDRFDQEEFLRLTALAQLEVRRCETSSNETKNTASIQAGNTEIKIEDLKWAQAMLIRSGVNINSDLLAHCPDLQIIITGTSGFDHIDLEACQAKNIRVAYTPEANVNSAAEHCFALLLSLVRKTSQAHNRCIKGQWRSADLVGTELAGKNFAIIGLGRIGKKVAQIANAFSMNVFAYDPYLEASDFEKHNCQRLSLEECLKMADIVSIHTPKSKETKHMFRRSSFEHMNENAILINCARGSCVFEDDLIWALENQVIAGAAIDVFESEPLKMQSKLCQLNNIILSPHIAASTHEALARCSKMASEKLLNFIAKKDIGDELPPKEMWFTSPMH